LARLDARQEDLACHQAKPRRGVAEQGLTLIRVGRNRATIRRMGWTVLVVDDHAEFRSVASALAAVTRLRPDVVLLDVQLPDIDGFVVAERLASDHDERHPNPAVVLVSSRAASSYRRRLAACPTVGFINKKDLSAAAVTALLPARRGAAR
jgi:CheY-like chemotaxis protein